MFLCPRVRLEARTQVQWAGRTHQHWGQPGSVAAGFRCRRSPGTKPLGNSPAPSGDRCMPQAHCQPALETFAKCWRFIDWRVGRLEAELGLRRAELSLYRLQSMGRWRPTSLRVAINLLDVWASVIMDPNRLRQHHLPLLEQFRSDVHHAVQTCGGKKMWSVVKSRACDS